MYPFACNSAIAAFNCGIEAEMFGNLMMLASGVFANSPSSAKASSILCSSVRYSGNTAIILPAKEISLVSTSTPAVSVNAFTIGKNEYVANAGA